MRDGRYKYDWPSGQGGWYRLAQTIRQERQARQLAELVESRQDWTPPEEPPLSPEEEEQLF